MNWKNIWKNQYACDSAAVATLERNSTFIGYACVPACVFVCVCDSTYVILGATKMCLARTISIQANNNAILYSRKLLQCRIVGCWHTMACSLPYRTHTLSTASQACCTHTHTRMRAYHSKFGMCGCAYITSEVVKTHYGTRELANEWTPISFIKRWKKKISSNSISNSNSKCLQFLFSIWHFSMFVFFVFVFFSFFSPYHGAALRHLCCWWDLVQWDRRKKNSKYFSLCLCSSYSRRN